MVKKHLGKFRTVINQTCTVTETIAKVTSLATFSTRLEVRKLHLNNIRKNKNEVNQKQSPKSKNDMM